MRPTIRSVERGRSPSAIVGHLAMFDSAIFGNDQVADEVFYIFIIQINLNRAVLIIGPEIELNIF